jgi:hydrogenase maturation protease
VSSPDGPLVVIGIGNVLLRDDGVGVHVVEALRGLAGRGEVALPAGTRLVDGGTLCLELLPEIDASRAVLFVDAADLGRAPGAVGSMNGDALRHAPAGPGRPGDGVAGLLAMADLAGVMPAAVALVGIQPQTIDAGLAPTDVVQAAIPAAVATTLAELGRLAAATQVRRTPVGPAREMTGTTV